MAFTSTDLANIESAIIALATGDKVVQVIVGDKNIKYADTDLTKLRELRSLIQTELGNIITRAYGKQGGRASG